MIKGLLTFPARPEYELKWDIPSIAQQAKDQGWVAGEYNFGKAKNSSVDYFNCSLLDKHDGEWLVTRRSKHVKGISIGLNDIVAFKLENNVPVRGHVVDMEKRFGEREHTEDPRAFYHNGRTFVIATNFAMPTTKSWTGAHQIICEVDDKWRLIKRYDPDYMGNGSCISTRKTNQKNWTVFRFDNAWHMVYWACPHTVARFDDKFNVVDEWKTNWDDSIWKFGQVRGGSCPVQVGSEYFTFAHASTPWTKTKRQYHTLFYGFEAQPPFRITRITPQPILSGSKYDIWTPEKPACMFCCGSTYKNGMWKISYGINDISSGYAFIPHADILDRCITIS